MLLGNGILFLNQVGIRWIRCEAFFQAIDRTTSIEDNYYWTNRIKTYRNLCNFTKNGFGRFQHFHRFQYVLLTFLACRVKLKKLTLRLVQVNPFAYKYSENENFYSFWIEESINHRHFLTHFKSSALAPVWLKYIEFSKSSWTWIWFPEKLTCSSIELHSL